MAQEAFLRLHGGIREGAKIKDVRAWLFRVARNLWTDHERERKRHWTTSPDDGSRSILSSADSRPDPEQQLLQRERLRAVEQEASRLPKLQRECLHLRAQGLRYHEIAMVLDISMTAAVDSVRQAVKRIGRRFSD